MKKYLIAAIIMIQLVPTYSQKWDFYYYTQTDITNNIVNNKHERYNLISINLSDNVFVIGKMVIFSDLHDVKAIAFGRNVKLCHDTLYCSDIVSHTVFKFKFINTYTIETLNNTAIFKKGERFYLHESEMPNGQSFKAFLYPSDLVHSTYWKTGIREGIHRYIDRGSDKLIMYKNDKAIDSLVVTEDSLALKSFLEKYH